MTRTSRSVTEERLPQEMQLVESQAISIMASVLLSATVARRPKGGILLHSEVTRRLEAFVKALNVHGIGHHSTEQGRRLFDFSGFAGDTSNFQKLCSYDQEIVTALLLPVRFEATCNGCVIYKKVKQIYYLLNPLLLNVLGVQHHHLCSIAH